MSKRRKKRQGPRGLMKLEEYASNKFAPAVSPAQVDKILTLYEAVQQGRAHALRYDTMAHAAWALRLLVFHAPCKIVLEFTPHEIMIALLNDDKEQVGWFLITTKQTGIGKRSRKLRESERSGNYNATQVVSLGAATQA